MTSNPGEMKMDKWIWCALLDEFSICYMIVISKSLCGQQTGPLHIYHAYFLMHFLSCDSYFTHEASYVDITMHRRIITRITGRIMSRESFQTRHVDSDAM